MKMPAAYALRISPTRLAQLQALRDRLNRAGDWYYSNDALTRYIDRTPEWNRHRITLRNRLNYILAIAPARST